MARTKTTVGIVGAGEIATKVHLPVLTALDRVSVSYITDLNPRVAALAGSSYGVPGFALPQKLADLPHSDAVLLATPVGARAPYYELFAGRGTAVLAEKPLAITSEEAERVCDLFADGQLVCGFQRRAFATVDAARSAIVGNWFGPVRGMAIEEGARTTKTGTDARFYDSLSTAGGGILRDLGCHGLDVALYISGASSAVPLHQQFVFDNSIDREIRAALRVSAAAGQFDLNLFVTWLAPTENVTRIDFEACSLLLPSQPGQQVSIVDHHGRPTGIDLTSGRRRALTVYQAFYLEWEAFLDGLESGQSCDFSARSCLPTIKAIEALYLAGTAAP